VRGGAALVIGAIAYFALLNLASPWPSIGIGVGIVGIVNFVSQALFAGVMVWSSRVGKLKARDTLLARIPWRGDEIVLDVGCGRGLLLIGAAKRLTTGRAIGIDIWQQEDQAHNSKEATLANATAEDVRDRVEVRDADMRQIPFKDRTMDVIVSNLAIHNVYQRAERAKALAEIVRVLRPGGRIAIMDMQHVEQYADAFRAAGLSDVQVSKRDWRIFPPVRTVTATRPK